MKCRHCGQGLQHPFLDLGTAPPSNAYLTQADLAKPELYFPLRVLVCDHCWLVQTEDFTNVDQLFTSEYGYFSATSKSWLNHCENFVNTATKRFGLSDKSMVVEIAANDGYLLQFVQEKSIPCLGIEPTASTAAAARELGLEIVEEFFGEDLGQKLSADGKTADLTIANNVLAHVPFINDFVTGFAKILKQDGVACFEFPHLLQLVKNHQFDTIYHEHYSYLSLTALTSVFEKNGLAVFDVEELSTHGGSLRLYAQRKDTGKRCVTDAPARILREEAEAGSETLSYYANFQKVAEHAKNSFVRYLIACRDKELKVAAYGAAAKGNTFMNFAGIGKDLLPYVVDRSPGKLGRFMPGSRIPIVDETTLKQDKPDRIVILPWNIKDEVSEQLEYARRWDTKFVVAIPELNEW